MGVMLSSNSYTTRFSEIFTCDHRTLKTRLPVRSARFKQSTGGLVLRWVTTGESPLLYVTNLFLQLLAQPCEDKNGIIGYSTAMTLKPAKRYQYLFGEQCFYLPPQGKTRNSLDGQ
ncbi:hypothetical protein C7974DRAFT_102913 [Boeremia exigua]|uniref:uncharacterized protein n=1 Tax=Boeremia exigua TaxID=749465 RepID=UPI001E8E40F7|nr:uncharacterized protein C7974DRAFT_102913 [Boeremia exigua]KAH6642462.1 hypothetical protein C7974DRAFT_102913 [Boeremia exigua]